MSGHSTVSWRSFLHLLSIASFGLLLLAIFAIGTDLVGVWTIAPVLGTLAGAVGLRYSVLYHRFSNPLYGTVLAVPFAGVLVVSTAATSLALFPAVSASAVRRVVESPAPQPTSHTFLPEWWIGVPLVAAGVLALLGLLWSRDTSAYPRPGSLRGLARSPVYFGFACTIVGLWAVLFVGISIQRVIVIAPLFEETLKFGVALVIGASLFGRSTAARVAVAAVVGFTFGLVEHATTYPGEADAIYLFRSLFHMITTVLSVSVYTRFEATGRDDLRWIAPALSILVHFFYNTFAVLSGVLSVIVLGSSTTTPTLVYGGLGIALLSVLSLLTWSRSAFVEALYEPLAHVLSDLV